MKIDEGEFRIPNPVCCTAYSFFLNLFHVEFSNIHFATGSAERF